MKVTAVPKPVKLTKEEKLTLRFEKARLKSKEKLLKARQPKISELKKSVQKAVNRYIRLRDEGKVCISCQKPPKSVDAGHYINQGSSGALRYTLDNLHAQCDSCNRFKSGNKVEYRYYLVKKIGEKRVKYLEEHRHDIHHWTREELEAVKSQATELITILKENSRLVLVEAPDGQLEYVKK